MSLLLLMDDYFDPRSLFAAGEQGIWLDPSDFSTLFQDSAGTTPVTAVGQPVGLALDKRLGLVAGSERLQDFVTGLGGSATAATYNTSTGVGSVTQVDLSNQSFVRITGLTATSGYRMSITNTGAVGISIRQVDYFGTIVANVSTGATVSLLFTGNATCVITSAGGTTTFVLNSFRELPGNHAYQTTAASRLTIQQDSNGMYYLQADGVDDGMVTNSIDFTGTDKMTVWAGVRKSSSAVTQCLIELSPTKNINNGVFAIFSPLTPATDSISYTSKGSIETTIEPLQFPVGTYVLACESAISAKTHVIRKNGVQISTSNSNQGTGNFGNYPLYLFRRAGTSLPFNGRIYQLIVRGAASNASQIAATEAYVNAKTRAF